MVWLRSYKQVLESHRDSSLQAAYSDIEASALAQAIVAKPLPETAFGRPAVTVRLQFHTQRASSNSINPSSAIRRFSQS
jgi:hypothetical protein